MKTLILEGAGMEWKDVDINNHRIRTRIKNNDGRVIYFESSGLEKSKYTERPFDFTGYVSHCFYDDIAEDSKNNHSKELSHIESIQFEYSKNGLLEFINKHLNCSFEDVLIDDGARVHDTEKNLC